MVLIPVILSVVNYFLMHLHLWDSFLRRAYLSVEEYRDVLGFDSSEKLNVFFATWTVKQLIGLATFPWEKNLYTVQGGLMSALGRTGEFIYLFIYLCD